MQLSRRCTCNFVYTITSTKLSWALKCRPPQNVIRMQSSSLFTPSIRSTHLAVCQCRTNCIMQNYQIEKIKSRIHIWQKSKTQKKFVLILYDSYFSKAVYQVVTAFQKIIIKTQIIPAWRIVRLRKPRTNSVLFPNIRIWIFIRPVNYSLDIFIHATKKKNLKSKRLKDPFKT